MTVYTVYNVNFVSEWSGIHKTYTINLYRKQKIKTKPVHILKLFLALLIMLNYLSLICSWFSYDVVTISSSQLIICKLMKQDTSRLGERCAEVILTVKSTKEEDWRWRNPGIVSCVALISCNIHQLIHH